MGGGDSAYDTGWVGDLTIITKYALINNRRTGNVFSVGFALWGAPRPIALIPLALLGLGVYAALVALRVTVNC